MFDDDADQQNIDKTVDAFEHHCVGEVNETYERYFIFSRRVQDTAETFDVFVADLRRTVRSCAFSDLEDSLLRDRIVVGIRDDATRKKLLQVRKLNLKHAVDICKAAEPEAATKQLKAISHGEEVHAINSTPTKSQHRSSRHRRRDSKGRLHHRGSALNSIK